MSELITFKGRVWEINNTLVITIPKWVANRYNLKVGYLTVFLDKIGENSAEQGTMVGLEPSLPLNAPMSSADSSPKNEQKTAKNEPNYAVSYSVNRIKEDKNEGDDYY